MPQNAPIIVLPRQEAEALVPPVSAACISITNPRQAPAALAGWADVLHIEFHDIDRPYGHFVEMKAVHAKNVIAFAKKHEYSRLYVHCEFGVSRSVAIGQFLSRWLKKPYIGPGAPGNTWVTQMLMRQARREGLIQLDWALLRVATGAIKTERGYP